MVPQRPIQGAPQQGQVSDALAALGARLAIDPTVALPPVADWGRHRLALAPTPPPANLDVHDEQLAAAVPTQTWAAAESTFPELSALAREGLFANPLASLEMRRLANPSAGWLAWGCGFAPATRRF